MSIPTRRLTVTVNGTMHGPLDEPVGMMMIDVLHEMLDLTGSRLGFVNAATVLLEQLKRHPIPREKVEETVAAALESHICRCTGYERYFEAVRDLILATPDLRRAT